MTDRPKRPRPMGTSVNDPRAPRFASIVSLLVTTAAAASTASQPATAATAGTTATENAAAFARSATVLDPSCAASPTDLDERPRRFSDGSTRFKGLCMNTGRYRPPHGVDVSGGRLRFRNYVHDGRFWAAELDGDFSGNAPAADPIEKVWFQIMRFAVVEGVEAAHSQLRFQLRPGREVRLTNQVDGSRSSNGDVLVTFEAGLPKDQTYNFALGAFDSYALIGRAGSTMQKHLERRGDVSIEQYEIRLEPGERARLLAAALSRSQSLGADFFYNTLRPNCTTEVFDLIDALPRVNDLVRSRGLRPFLTFLSTDPIATPSLRALRDRGLLGPRGPDFEDELAGRSVARETPPLVDRLPNFVPAVEGRPWTVVSSRSGADALSREESEALEAVRDELVSSSLRLLQGAAAAFVLAKDDAFVDVLTATLARLPGEVARVVRSVDPRLPARLHKIAVHVAPMPARGGGGLDLTRFGIPAAAPISAQASAWGLDRPEGRALAWNLREGSLLAADAAAASGARAYLLGVAVVVNAARGRSNVISQIRAGLAPLERPFQETNEQVELDSLRIGSAAAGPRDRPTVLLTHRQTAASETVNPIVRVDFGPDGGLAGDANGDGDSDVEATFQPRRGLGDCEIQAAAVPHLTGRFGPSPTTNGALNAVLRGRPVAFQVMGLDLDLRGLRATDMDVLVRAWPYSCREDGSAERQFRDQANEALARLKTQGFAQRILSKAMAER